MMKVIVWIILVVIRHQIGGNVITVDNHGNNSTKCCVVGQCHCSSLFNALESISNSTIIKITSESVELHNHTSVISKSNITITGNDAVICCNNSGSVFFLFTINVTIHGITWDQCGNPNDSHVEGGISFGSSNNPTIENCTFQNSQICAVSLSALVGEITVKSSSFISNGVSKTIASGEGICGGLWINAVVGSIVISNSVFSGNGRSINRQYFPIYGLFIQMDDSNITLTINRTDFVSNFGGMYLEAVCGTFSTFTLSEVNVSDNINKGIFFKVQISDGDFNLMVLNTTFSNNGNGGLKGFLFAGGHDCNVYVLIDGSNFTDNKAINFSNRALSLAITSSHANSLSVNVQHSNFINNTNGTIYISTSQGTVPHVLTFNNVIIKECIATGSSSGSGSVVISLHSSLNNTYYFRLVRFIANEYSGIAGGALFLKTTDAENDIFIINCLFHNNKGVGQGAAIYVADGVLPNSDVYQTVVKIDTVNFTNNSAGNSVVYVEGGTINNTQIVSVGSRYINNNGTVLHLFMSKLIFEANTRFENNFANNGAALYLEQGTRVHIDDKYNPVIIEFVNNVATQYGGAIYTDVPSTCLINGVVFDSVNWDLNISFVNNSAGIIGDSMYFNIRGLCKVTKNVSNSNSLLYLPYKFNYSEPLNKSIVTSPNSVILYFTNNDGSYITNKTVYIRNKILGKAITFSGAVFDYFNNPAQPTQFHARCLYDCANYTLADDRLLVDNVSFLSITVYGSRIDFNPINVTLLLTSVLASFNKQISLQLVIELLPCFSGYFYNEDSRHCVCYHHKDIVECYNDYNEIKRGYWFGTVTYSFEPTVSLCPSRYCYFGKRRNETRQGYCILPSQLDDQCNSHRTGVACGQCKSGYTLAYDLPNCINKDKCSPGMTILVIVLTIIYWISIVAFVFAIMHCAYRMDFRFDKSLGYAYGIIYYYSIVDILLDNNPYISDAVFQFIAVLSSFAELTPQLFGQLCLVEGLSGIDQQFIHYSHAIAVLLIIVSIVIAARYSPRLLVYVRRYIISVICVLLLLSYTSLASTSFQLLRPTHYPGFNGLYVYISPEMRYFNNRHSFYGVVAFCGMILAIGFPVFLLLEPLVLSRWFNFVKVKPLLDMFQGCYKDGYRFFAAYYLICRQVIIVIVYFGNDDYYEMLYYLQTACVVIAMLHIWIQPYTDSFLNAFDGIVLLTIVLTVNANTFTFLSSATSVIIIVLILLPLIVFCVASGQKLMLHYKAKRLDREPYNLLDSTSIVDDTDDVMDNNTNYGRYSRFIPQYTHVWLLIAYIILCY